MHQSVRWLALVLAVAGCGDRSESVIRQDSEATAVTGGAPVMDSQPGLELEAPRLVPGIRAQIAAIGRPDGATPENFTALKNGVGTLVDAMTADLQRARVSDTGAFKVAADSLLRAFGAGAGSTAKLSGEEGRQIAGDVDGLIRMYEERMRRATR